MKTIKNENTRKVTGPAVFYASKLNVAVIVFGKILPESVHI
jgi:hypothetical protein